MNTVEISGDIVDLIDEFRERTLEHAWNQVVTAMDMFSSGQYETACFLSMTAIEEAGKVGLLQFIRGNELMGTPAQVDTNELQSILNDHSGKALRAAASALCVNTRAKRVHGKHPDCDLELSDGLLLLTRAGNQWEIIREKCLYTDIDLHAKSLSTPSQEINKDHAYYFICMAGEVVAEEAERGFGSFIEARDPTDSIEFWSRTTDKVDEFVDQYNSEFNPSKIGFFTDPRFDDLRDEIGESLEITEDQMEFATQMGMTDVRLRALMDGKSEKEAEKIAEEYSEAIEDSFAEFAPSKQCVKEFERLAEDVVTVTISDDE